MAGIYVHFPFCSARCIYCDFYSRVRKDKTGYTEALVAEISANRDFFRSVSPSTLYFGGGTPSLFPVEDLELVAQSARETFSVGRFDEFTIEVNPDDVTAGKTARWLSMGVNRISMGVQSFDDRHLKWMKRRHTARQAEEAFRTLRAEAPGAALSIDLIFGFDGLSDEDWKATINRAMALRPDHISCYQMTGRYASSSEEACFRQYGILQAILTAEGYEQYEISNYALEGCRSLHNSGYWKRTPYLGVGAAAHSFDGLRTRRWNVSDIDRYIAGEKPGFELLTDEEILEETVMLSLRTAEGLDLSLVPERYLTEMRPALERLSKAGDIVLCGNLLKIPPERLFVSDWIVSRLLAY
ncbi:MAG: coproporphyrinogen III oxidase family protein [Bacteroidales bacterium]|nr:coproporphyrinogen III oxidase family protein [Candidatus Cacconaster merdequi]